VNAPELLSSREFVVALDYGHFYLVGRRSRSSSADDVAAVVAEARQSDGVAQADGIVVVNSPHQNNFEMNLTVERWDSKPLADWSEWQIGFEASLRVRSSGLWYESPTWEPVDLIVPPDSYRLRIVGRGFVAPGWPGSTEPGDSWRVQLWPSAVNAAARRIVDWSPDS
jgi:hypothetical protein